MALSDYRRCLVAASVVYHQNCRCGSGSRQFRQNVPQSLDQLRKDFAFIKQRNGYRHRSSRAHDVEPEFISKLVKIIRQTITAGLEIRQYAFRCHRRAIARSELSKCIAKIPLLTMLFSPELARGASWFFPGYPFFWSPHLRCSPCL